MVGRPVVKRAGAEISWLDQDVQGCSGHRWNDPSDHSQQGERSSAWCQHLDAFPLQKDGRRSPAERGQSQAAHTQRGPFQAEDFHTNSLPKLGATQAWQS